MLALILGGIAFLILILRIGSNPKAKKGTQGLIVGEVKKYDEKEHVFARNRAIRPDSEQYHLFYKDHPEYEKFDAKRREKGGPVGRPGKTDSPHDGLNVAATPDSLSLPLHLSTPDKIKPEAPPKLRDKKVHSMSLLFEIILFEGKISPGTQIIESGGTDRYPNGFPAGAPMDFYDQPTAEEAVKLAETILGFVGPQL